MNICFLLFYFVSQVSSHLPNIKAAEDKHNSSDYNENNEDLLMEEVVTEKIKEEVILDESTLGVEPEIEETVVSQVIDTETKQEIVQVN